MRLISLAFFGLFQNSQFRFSFSFVDEPGRWLGCSGFRKVRLFLFHLKIRTREFFFKQPTLFLGSLIWRSAKAPFEPKLSVLIDAEEVCCKIFDEAPSLADDSIDWQKSLSHVTLKSQRMDRPLGFLSVSFSFAESPTNTHPTNHTHTLVRERKRDLGKSINTQKPWQRDLLMGGRKRKILKRMEEERSERREIDTRRRKKVTKSKRNKETKRERRRRERGRESERVWERAIKKDREREWWSRSQSSHSKPRLSLLEFRQVTSACFHLL